MSHYYFRDENYVDADGCSFLIMVPSSVTCFTFIDRTAIRPHGTFLYLFITCLNIMSLCVQTLMSWIQTCPIWRLWVSPAACQWLSLTPLVLWKLLCSTQTPAPSPSLGLCLAPAVAPLLQTTPTQQTTHLTCQVGAAVITITDKDLKMSQCVVTWMSLCSSWCRLVLSFALLK